jgi:transposase-like protein
MKEDTMTPHQESTQQELVSQTEFHELLRDKLREAVRYTLIQVLEAEAEACIGAAAYERVPTRQDYRNGHYRRNLVTGVGEVEALPVPRTRNGFKTQVFEHYQRRQAELDEAICDMFVSGGSTAQVGQIVEKLTRTKPSPSTVSRVFHGLEDEFEHWKKRQLAPAYLYVFADGTYFSVIYGQEGHKMPILAVIGITVEGQREVLAFRVGERENQMAWEDLMDDLKERGVEKVGLWITDGNQATINAVEHKFSDSARQRCIKHKMDNILGYIPKKQQELVKPELKAIFYQANRQKADQEVAAFIEKFEPIYPTAIECLNRDLAACLTFYDFPKEHWKTIRTTNVIERMFLEVKRRSKKMGAAFRNENSCLLMFYAVMRGINFQRIPISTKN